MSKFKEYLKLIPKGLPNFDKIVSGVINEVKLEYGLLPEDEQEEIMRRRLICNQCPLFSKNVLKDQSEYVKLFGVEYSTDRLTENHCSICGCPEKIRTSSLEADCGLIDYNENNPDNIQELKWKKYK